MQALVYEAEKGSIIITGCSHAGICNILNYAIQITGKSRIEDIVGGLHLMNASSELIEKTIKELKNYKVANLHACHCTGCAAREMLRASLPQEDIGCSFEKNYD